MNSEADAPQTPSNPSTPVPPVEPPGQPAEAPSALPAPTPEAEAPAAGAPVVPAEPTLPGPGEPVPPTVTAGTVREGVVLALLWFLIATAWRVPFIFCYDLNFGSESGLRYLMSKQILHGNFLIFFWESDYMGASPQYLTAALFALFGPSIELACLVSVLAYAAAVALGVYYVYRHWGRGYAVAAGLFAAIGVPYTLVYNAQPPGSGYDFALLIPAAFLGLAVLVYERGWTLGGCLGAGLLTGHCFYYNRQTLISLLTIGIVFISQARGRQLLRELLRPNRLAIFVAAAVLGFSPEILYRLANTSKHQLFGLASAQQMVHTLGWVVRTLPAYFDGDPLSRLPEGVHYLEHDPTIESVPQTMADLLGIAIAWTVVGLMLWRLGWAWRRGRVPVVLMALYPVVNVLLLMSSKIGAGEYYGPKRYLYTCAVLLVLWAGIECWNAVQQRRWLLAGLIGLLLPMSVIHQWRLLRMPDELQDYRAVVQDLREGGYRYGVTWFMFADALTALSNEAVVFSAWDYNDHAVYHRQVAGQDPLVLVYPSPMEPPPRLMKFFGRGYRRQGPPHVDGELSWIAYRKVSEDAPSR